MEIPHFVDLQNQYRDRLAVVGLSYDQGSADDLKRFLKEMNVNYDIYMGTEEIANHVGLRGIPHTLVLDSGGRVRRTYIGYKPKEAFEKDIVELSRETPAAASGTRP